MTVTVQPAVQVRPACRTEPDLWHSTDSAVRALAVHICRNHCLFRDQCGTFPAPAGGVQDGILYAYNGVPVRPRQQPKPSARNCTTCNPCNPFAAVEPKPCDDPAVTVARIRELAGLRWSDGRIAAEVGKSRRQIIRLRRRNGIGPGIAPYRTRVAA